MLNFVNFRHCNFFVSANNKRKSEEELYTSSFEEIPENGSIADEIIQQYKKTSVAVDKAYPPVDKSDSEWIKLLVNLDQSSQYKDNVLSIYRNTWLSMKAVRYAWSI